MFHYFQKISSEDQYLDDSCHSQNSNAFLISGISNYNHRVEDDLFNAPEPIIEPLLTLDHMISPMSMILCEEEVVSEETMYINFESLQNEDFMNNCFYEYKDILAEETLSPSHVMNFELPATEDDGILVKENLQPLGKMIYFLSTDSLTYMDVAQTRPSYLDLTEMELNKVHGMRWAFSEGYIKPQLIDDHPTEMRLGQPQLINDHTTETRLQKLSRYRDKKTKRNFGKKIKYACRKALADGQPRIKGRFAKTEETDVIIK